MRRRIFTPYRIRTRLRKITNKLRGNPHMTISRQLLHQIVDPSLSKDERALLRCQLAKELEDVGNYEAAREARGELWPRFEERPVLDGLDEETATEVLLRVGALTGWIGSDKQIEG